MLLTFLLAALVGSSASGLDKTVSLGRTGLWSDLASADNVVLQSGDGGFPVLALRTDEYTATSSTDLLLHFNGGSPTDAAGHYRTLSSTIGSSEAWARLGPAAGVFQDEPAGVELAPSAPAALFQPGTHLHDFTIEFWLYPATLSDGETIFLWRGARSQQGTVVPQSIRCSIQNSRLTWSFRNFFDPPSQAPFSLTLEGSEDLVPRQWHHFTLRFDAQTGMVEYLIDGRPDAITYANQAHQENGTVYLPTVGSGAESRITIGSGLTGFLDELRISNAFIAHPVVTRYGTKPGVAITKPIDLGSTDSLIQSITAQQTTPGDTGVFYYYRTANQESSPQTIPGTWTQFSPGSPLSPPPTGRFVQFKIELLPDGTGERTPTVSDLSLTYQPRLPPPAPAYLTATPGNGTISLSWRRVVDPNLKGYEIFYGQAPHQYFGSDSSSGPSPVDVGNVTSFTLSGLTNGKLYYIAVVAYDTSTPPHLSPFSNEVAARPSRIAGGTP